MVNDAEVLDFPTEFLNQQEPAGFPPHKLQLKVGMPIMILRNIDPPAMCNGTRLIVSGLHPNVIEGELIMGPDRGKKVLIPRIPMIPRSLPFEFKRVQFPVVPCFAMTINKSQGQTLQVAGLHLAEPCFSHGQLYVACSRVGHPSNLFINTSNGTTNNIVYTEIL